MTIVISAMPGGDIITANPQYFSNGDEAAARMPDISTGDLEAVGGMVFINRTTAEIIAGNLLGANSYVEVTPLPVFEAAIQSGKTAAAKIPVNGTSLGVNNPSDILLLKVISSNNGEFLRYAAAEADYDDGKFTLLAKGSETPYTGNINPGAEYDLMIFIRDGGRFDLDKAVNGAVIDPTAIVRRVQQPGNGGDGGSGGCNAGWGFLAFIGTVPLILGKKK